MKTYNQLDYITTRMLKAFLTLLVVGILSAFSMAYAGGSGSAAQAGSSAQGLGQAAAYGSDVNIDSHGRSYSYAPDLSRSVPTVIAPSLTTSSESCMGSTSGGIGVSGFGITFGSTWSDDYCRRRLDARQWHSMGLMPIGKEVMCVSDENYEAAKRAGLPCVLREDDALTDDQELQARAMQEQINRRRKYADIQALEKRWENKFRKMEEHFYYK